MVRMAAYLCGKLLSCCCCVVVQGCCPWSFLVSESGNMVQLVQRCAISFGGRVGQGAPEVPMALRLRGSGPQGSQGCLTVQAEMTCPVLPRGWH